jgi:HK97 family phage major capsid protein
MKLLQTKSAEREMLVKEVAVIFAKGDENLTNDDLSTIETKNTAIDALEGEITRLKSIEDIALKNAERAVQVGGVDASGRPGATVVASSSEVVTTTKDFLVPARLRGSNPKHFRSISATQDDAEKKAYRMGAWLLATLMGSQKHAAWCNDHGYTIVKAKNENITSFRAQAENVNEAGGFLVPHELNADLIQLREQFGVARQLFKKATMHTDTMSIPRRTGGLQAYHLTDNDAITASQKGWDSVNLTAVKIAALALYSNELSEDAIINIADDLAYEIAWAFALTEDADAFLGDGTSAYGGFVGVSKRLTDTWSVGGGAGLILGGANTGTNWGNFVLGDFNKVKGALPRYAALANPCWVTTTEFYSAVMEKLLVAAGGNRVQDVENGGDMEKFLGKPIVFAQVLPLGPALSSIPLYYGAFNLGATFGDRRETTIALSEQFAFANDQMAIRGTERYAINVHDVGGASNAANPTQPGPQPGPIVGLISSAN